MRISQLSIMIYHDSGVHMYIYLYGKLLLVTINK